MAKLLIGILIIAGAGVLIFTTGNRKQDVDTSNQTEEVEINEENESEDFNEKTTLASLMKEGGNYMCTFSHKTEVGDSTGTVYIAKERIRGDFISKVSIEGMGNMGNIETHMISDGESSYTWSSMSSDGYKVEIDKEANAENQSQVPTNQELDYKCVKWSVDNTKFSLPTNITFKTL